MAMDRHLAMRQVATEQAVGPAVVFPAKLLSVSDSFAFHRTVDSPRRRSSLNGHVLQTSYPVSPAIANSEES